MSYDDGPRIPITGSAGRIVAAALRSLALNAGEGEITIRKQRAAAGGYVYVIFRSTPQPPVPPVANRSKP